MFNLCFCGEGEGEGDGDGRRRRSYSLAMECFHPGGRGVIDPPLGRRVDATAQRKYHIIVATVPTYLPTYIRQLGRRLEPSGTNM